MAFPPPTQKQARVLWSSLTWLSVAVILGLIGLFVWGLGWVLGRLSAVLMPMAVALILAYILDPVVEFLVRKKVPRIWSIIIVFVVTLGALGGLLGSVLPGIIDESRRLVTELPKNVAILQRRLDDFMEHSSLGRHFPESWRFSPESATKSPRDSSGGNAGPTKPGGTNMLSTNAPAATNSNQVELNLSIKVTDHTNSASSGARTNSVEIPAETFNKALNARIGGVVLDNLARAVALAANWATNQVSKVTTWMEFIVGFILVPVYLFYFLLEKKRINRRWTDYLPIQESRAKEEVVFVLRAINDCMIAFFRGQVLVALCVGTLLSIGYLILGLNYAVLLGIVAAVLGIVPYLGTIVSLLLALIVAAIQFGDWLHPLIVLGIAAVVKLLEDFVISPKIMGDRSGLHPLTIIVAVLIGANLLGGLLGALLAIPLTAVLRTLMFRYVWKDREEPEPKAGPRAHSTAGSN